MVGYQALEVDAETLEPKQGEKRGRGRLSVIEEIERQAETISNKVGQKVVNEVMAQAQQRASDMLDELKKHYTPRTIVAGIKVNDSPTVKLDGVMHSMLPQAIGAAKLGHNVMLVGPAGCGKTTLAGQIAKTLQREYSGLCCSSGMSESWLFGRYLPTGEFKEASFSRLYRDGGVFLLDEMDAADSNVMMSINTALDNGFLENPISGKRFYKSKDFVCVAGANTYGTGANAKHTGRNRLDSATLSRFTRLELDYDLNIEELLCPNKKLREKMQGAREKLRAVQSTETVSSRDMRRVYELVTCAAWSEADALKSITMHWNSQLVKDAGLFKEISGEEIPF